VNLLKFGLMACVLGIAVYMIAGVSHAQGDKGLKIGDAAPNFDSVDEQGKPWSSKDHVGKKIVVVYFYPADFTGGCTAQACGFRDDMSKLTGLNVEVVGVSGDSAKTHAAFKEVHKLNFTLLADEKGTVAKAFGVPFAAGEKKAKYKDSEFVRAGTASRWTFVIGTDGKIALRNSAVKAGEDSKKVIETVKALGK